MKEATGELNATVVVVTAVAFLMAFFYFTAWPSIKGSMDQSLGCSKAICEACNRPNHDCTVVKCHLKGKTETFDCPYKG